MHEPCLPTHCSKYFLQKIIYFVDPTILEHNIINGNIVDYIVLTHILRELTILILLLLLVLRAPKSASAPNPLIPQ
jgi:hypothetical protein